MIQDNTRVGVVPILAAAAIAADQLLGLSPEGVKPTATEGDLPLYVAVNDADQGATADCQPLSGERSVAVQVSTAVALGDSVAIDTVNAGLAKKAAASSAAFGVVEQAAAVGDRAIIRPVQHTTPA